MRRHLKKRAIFSGAFVFVHSVFSKRCKVDAKQEVVGVLPVFVAGCAVVLVSMIRRGKSARTYTQRPLLFTGPQPVV